MSIRVIVADDHDTLREEIKGVLEGIAAVEVVGEARDGHEAVALAADLGPDLLIMDVAMPELNGIEATKQIVASGSTVRILALSMHPDGQYVRGMLEAGAGGYVLKDCAAEDLPVAIAAVLAGEQYLSPGVELTVRNALPRTKRP